jgi:hypothetical protein
MTKISNCRKDHFLLPDDTPFDPAPAPPPGPALLDDTESSMLEQFFTTWDSNPFETREFFNGVEKVPGPFAFDLDELPPTFEGSTTSFGRSSQLPFPTTKGGFNFLGNNGLDPTSDLLAAASMSMLGQHGTSTNSFSTNLSPHILSNHSINSSPSSLSNNTRHLRHSDAGLHHHEARTMTNQHIHPAYPTEMFFAPSSSATNFSVDSPPRVLRWGSDTGFAQQGYQRPAHQSSAENITKELLDNLKCFEPRTSATTTRAPTPVRTLEDISSNSNYSGPNETTVTQNTQDSGARDGDRPEPRRKKLKISMKKEEDSDGIDEEENPRPVSKSKKPKTSGDGGSRRGRLLSSDRASSSRKAKSQPAKLARENLSEEQKRTNHILSEQRRRNLIKQGFDDMCSIVPELRGGGFSKSAILLQAADWLDDMIHGNEILSKQLAELKSMGGIIIPE